MMWLTPILSLLLVGMQSWTVSNAPVPLQTRSPRPARVGSSKSLVQSSRGRVFAKSFTSDLSRISTRLFQASKDENPKDSSLFLRVSNNPNKSRSFSAIMGLCGAALGPFLDSYHSAFGVLRYEEPITATLWGSLDQPALTTAWWVPELFGVAGFIIGWLYILLDDLLQSDTKKQNPSPPKILVGMSFFTLQYWLSGVLSFMGVSRTVILGVMSVLATLGFVALDGTLAGFITGVATAVGGPLIEVGLLSTLDGHGGYQYLDAGETGFFPLWIVPVYFLGGPAVGNLARGVWNQLPSVAETEEGSPSGSSSRPNCPVCNDTRCVSCPNCDGVGSYVTYGRTVQCTSCRGRGFVICRNCFSNYGEDPADIEAIRDLMSRMPD